MVTTPTNFDVLISALKESARNHHLVSRMREKQHSHSGQHWQYCPAPSCTRAFNALVTFGTFRQREIDIRKREIAKLINKAEQQYAIKKESSI